MSVISFLRDLTGLFNYSTDESPTTQQNYQAAVQNWVTTETSLVDAVLWQPETEYAAGAQVKTPTLGSQYVLVCTTAGTSGSIEADYSGIATGDTVTDGSVEWTVAEGFTTNGGTMTGTLNVSDTVNSVDGFVKAYGWGTLITVDNEDYAQAGAKLTLNTKNSNSVNNGTNLGYFNIEANDGVNSAILYGTPAGDLMWKNKTVITGTEYSQTFTTSALAANASQSFTLTAQPKYWSIISLSGSGWGGLLYNVNGSNLLSVINKNTSALSAGIKFTINYIA